MRKRLFASLAAAVMLTGCIPTPLPERYEDLNESSTNTSCIEDIRARGKLIAGCKADVPGLGLRDSATGEWSGLETELAYETAAGIFGVTADEARSQGLLELKAVTVADREEMLRSGEVDCLFATYTITPERKEKFALSESYYQSFIGIMVNDMGEDMNTLGGGDINSLHDLDGKYIGVPMNATTRKDFISYIETMDSDRVTPIFCEFESYDILYNALKRGNIDAMAVDVSILNGYSDSTTLILPDRFAGQNYGAAVIKDNSALIDIINSVIENHNS